MEMDHSGHTSIYVAPLQVNKAVVGRHNIDTDFNIQTSAAMQRLNGEMTPPLTPEDDEPGFDRQDEFHAYLRAFYEYQPSFEDEATITLPLNAGDIILVHSIHTNGWADGTMLTTGERGWLPTNYCEGYYKEPIGTLLHALTVFWDLVKSAGTGDHQVLKNSDYVRGLVAGVRFLLVWPVQSDMAVHVNVNSGQNPMP